ncbi:MAG: Fpg/Nei family DNA glycosylase [Candidatus Kapaibacterium sp.]
MPELPDLEVYKKYIDSTALHKKIDEVEITEDRVVEPDNDKLKTELKDKKFSETHRHGKYLFLDYGSGWLMMHFGMSGNVKYFKNDEERDEHQRVLFHLENGYSLAYVSQRMLGKIDLSESPDKYCSDNNIGPDAYRLSESDFVEKIKSKRGMIKTALMDQSLISGIGNIYSDEILFHARIHPETKISDLSDDDVRHIYEKMQKVFDEAIAGNVRKFPDNFLIPRREEGTSCPKCGGEVEKLEVGGRSTYICSRCQSL